MSLRTLLRTKPIEQLQREIGSAQQFRRVLGLWQLTAIGLGGLIGAGIFVLTGVVAATQAGPAVSLSFVIAGVASAAAALCYAEFAGMIPVAGSAYTYGYAVLGELVAWVIGWDLLLGYVLVVAVVSIGWSGYVQALLSLFGFTLPNWAMGAPGTGTGHVLDLPAMLGSLATAGLLTLNIEWGARFNTVMVIIKLAAVVLVVAAGLPHVNTANYHPFMPFVFAAWPREPPSCSSRSSATIRSRQRPKRRRTRSASFPARFCSPSRSHSCSTLRCPWCSPASCATTLNSAAPVAAAFTAIDMPWVTLIVSAAAVAGIASVMFAFMLGCARIWFAMSRDGLLPDGLRKCIRASHPLPPDADCRRTDSPCRGFLSHQAGRRVGEYRNALGFYHHLFLGHRAPADETRCPTHLPDASCPVDTPGRHGLFRVAALKTSRRRLGQICHWMVLGLLVYFLYGRRHSLLANKASMPPDG